MPHVTGEAHSGRCQWIISGKLQLGWEDATFERRAFWALDERFPCEHVILVDRTGSDAFWRILGDSLVFGEESLRCY